MEKTLVMVKPHAMGICNDIVRDLEVGIAGRGEKIFAKKIDNMPKAFFDNLYSINVRDTPFHWNEIIEKSLADRSAFFMVYEGKGIVPIVRNLNGVKQVFENPLDTIRGKYGRILHERGEGIISLSDGSEVIGNVIHATDETPGEYTREIKGLRDLIDPYSYSVLAA